MPSLSKSRYPYASIGEVVIFNLCHSWYLLLAARGSVMLLTSPTSPRSFLASSAQVRAPRSGEEESRAIRHSGWHLIMESGVIWCGATWHCGDQPPRAGEPKREARGGCVRKCACDKRAREIAGTCESARLVVHNSAESHTETRKYWTCRTASKGSVV